MFLGYSRYWKNDLKEEIIVKKYFYAILVSLVFATPALGDNRLKGLNALKIIKTGKILHSHTLKTFGAAYSIVYQKKYWICTYEPEKYFMDKEALLVSDSTVSCNSE